MSEGYKIWHFQHDIFLFLAFAFCLYVISLYLTRNLQLIVGCFRNSEPCRKRKVCIQRCIWNSQAFIKQRPYVKCKDPYRLHSHNVLSISFQKLCRKVNKHVNPHSVLKNMKIELILLVFYFLLKKYITENLRVFLYLSVVLVGKKFKKKILRCNIDKNNNLWIISLVYSWSNRKLN